VPLLRGIRKPFPEFKWRWATYQPSESLNDPRLFLGVLRVLKELEGEAPNSKAVYLGLKKVQEELKPYVRGHLSLARDKERNLLRNSQQYWTGLGVLDSTDPVIRLSSIGQSVARGEITREEFAATVVRTLELPNLNIERADIIAKWREHELKLFPLSLILSVIVGLAREDIRHAFLSNRELRRIVIPISSVSGSTVERYVEHIIAFRDDQAFAMTYEDFTPGSNDARISREFLLFLLHHGFLQLDNPEAENDNQRYKADLDDIESIRGLLELPLAPGPLETIASQVSAGGPIGTRKRERRMVSVTQRPGQRQFRKDVLSESGGRCLLTGETLQDVLRACHIIPVEKDGTDDAENGLCLREDVHLLFDSGHLRLDSEGNVHLSVRAKGSPSYNSLPSRVTLPEYVSKAWIEHRFNYMG